MEDKSVPIIKERLPREKTGGEKKFAGEERLPAAIPARDVYVYSSSESGGVRKKKKKEKEER